ncbi:sensor histidine kinase [Chitinophaga pinensis]|uniref:Signal transduction histidine kinase, LytS n=1 Tax=Chitinophaga pinensis (strain ATCC 43595 / DSM 2588 / LMG 13176 / NBRC 15968 / NCIMB 11800 / UQM 2034) TaxID=485918 RepID=A0A979GYX0_CHIPD|nr:histidine kinase [Chitinophaga pinensis]ACU63471.1 signal transduction histidine kinase, LytS [Chitinophaga pinensis DSM 2588]
MTNKRSFKVSPLIIWVSSIFLGILASVPKIAEHHFNTKEAVVNSAVTAIFALVVWYYNIYTLPTYSRKDIYKGISLTRLMGSLVFGMAVMLLLAFIQQLLISTLSFGPVMLMIEVRGILINLMFYMFLHLLYQNYHNQRVSIELERSKSDNLGAQYELLKQQINPHFLFNSLNTLKTMIEVNDKQSVDFVLKLSEFYRFTLESRKLDLIQLSEELDIISAYMFLLKARFEDGIRMRNDIPAKYQHTMIPPFTLQLLIENCVKHNVVSLEEPLEIRLYVEKDFIVIENDLQPKMDPAETSLHVGLNNVHERYHHLLDKDIVVEETDKIFKVKLPVIYEYTDHRR